MRSGANSSLLAYCVAYCVRSALVAIALFCFFQLFLTTLCADPKDRSKKGVAPPPSDAPRLERVRLEQVASGFTKPLHLAFPPGPIRSTYVVEQGGRIFRINSGKRRLFLDLSKTINSGRGEEGLLSLAFSPDYREGAGASSYLYVNYTAGRPSYSYVAEYKVAGRNPTVLPASRRTVLRFRQPYRNHNGGLLLFGPDGMLYIGVGDGGSGGDPLNAGQNPKTWLGKILRIQPRPIKNSKYSRSSKDSKDSKSGKNSKDSRNSESGKNSKDSRNSESGKNSSYQIPVDNPFYGNSSYLPEIYALGLRNPWRFSFDRANGRLYAADVGQGRQEEVSLIKAGGNYGWRYKEGRLCYNPTKNCSKPNLIDPIHAYSHSVGQSITGGYVYRGNRLRSYRGHYLFADYVSGNLWALPIDSSTGGAAASAKLLLSNAGHLSSFGEDRDGEIYATEHQAGKVFRLVPEG